jgi:hypothetical protein
MVKFQFIALFKLAQPDSDYHCHCEERLRDVAISYIELRCAARRGDSHGPAGLGMTR